MTTHSFRASMWFSLTGMIVNVKNSLKSTLSITKGHPNNLLYQFCTLNECYVTSTKVNNVPLMWRLSLFYLR